MPNDKMKISAAEQDRLIKDLAERKKSNQGKRIDNASLRAGAPMYYYCGMCDECVGSIGESDFWTRLPEHCEKCQQMIKCGYSTAFKRFLELKD